MANKIFRWFGALNRPSYIIFFVTARCNANCKMCFYKDHMANTDRPAELTVQEYEKISKHIKLINILGISGGEPFLRDDLADIIKVFYKNCAPLVVDLPTNAFLVDSVLRQTEAIAEYCKDMIIDLQLSIDGPEEVHDNIRALEGGYKRMKESYKGLILLKKRYRNLRVKACVVYSHYNQEHIEELFDILDRDFKDLDRVVFSVAHGSVSDPEAFRFDWGRYFAICENIRKATVVRNIGDFHSIFTAALRIAKNDLLKKILRTKDMYKICHAGKRVVAVNETGEVFPCEVLWHSVGNLRQNDYDLNRITDSDAMKNFTEKINREKCNCHWGLPMSNTLIYKPEYYPKIIYEMIRIAARSMMKSPPWDVNG